MGKPLLPTIMVSTVTSLSRNCQGCGRVCDCATESTYSEHDITTLVDESGTSREGAILVLRHTNGNVGHAIAFLRSMGVLFPTRSVFATRPRTRFGARQLYPDGNLTYHQGTSSNLVSSIGQDISSGPIDMLINRLMDYRRQNGESLFPSDEEDHVTLR